MILVLLIFSSWYTPTHPTHPAIHLTNNIICGDINTNNKSPVDNCNPGEIRVSHELLNDIHLVSGFIYQVQIVSNINIQSIQGLYIDINTPTDTKYNLTTCPLLDHLSNITFPLSLLWKPDINTDLTTTVEIKCIILYNEYFWLNISTVVTSPSGCVEYFTKPHDEITSPGFPNSYPDDLNCSYVILVDRKYTLDIQINTLKFEKPVLNMCQDYLEIKYDNITTEKMCGIYDFRQQRYQTKGNWAIIHFISDQALTSNGFQLFYYASDLYDCNTTVYETNGTITSLLYPSNYPPNLHCSTIILLPDGYRIFITISKLTLEDNNCHDILVITDNIYNITQTWCADKQYYSSKELMFESVSSGVTVIFSSDSHLQQKGFSLYYTAINVCSNNTFNGSDGTIKTTSYPESYMNNEICEYVINVDEQSNGILLSFLDFYTESPNDEKLQDKYCTKDYIEILMEHDSYKLCGNWRGSEEMPTFRSFVNSMSLRFVSDSENTKPGFHIAWKALTVDDRGSCIPTLMVDNDMCFEMIYETRSWRDSEQDCRSRGGHLASILNDLQQNALSVKLNESNCTDGGTSFWIGANDIQYEKDFQWIDGSKTKYSDWFQGWPQHNSASNQPSDDGWSGEDCVELRRSFNLPTKGSGLTVNYKWNDRDCRVKNFYVCQCYNKGFISTPKSSPDCDQVIHIQQIGVSVDIISPGHPNNYSNFLDCHITVISPPLSHLNLHFLNFHLEESIRCKYDFLSISTTPFAIQDNSTFKLCGNWTGKSKLLNKRKSSNLLFLRFFSDNSLTYSGFILSVSAFKAPIRCQALFPTDILTIGQTTVTAPEARVACNKKSSKLWQPLSKDERFSAALQYMNSDKEADIYTIWIEGNTSDGMCRTMTWESTQLDNNTIIPTTITIIPSTITIASRNCDNQHNFLCVSNCSVNTGNLNQTRYIEAGEQFVLYSYNFPYGDPTRVTRTIVVSAPLRYKLILHFLFVGLDTHESCKNASLIVQDISFGIQPVFDLCEVLNRFGDTKIRLLNDKTFSIGSLFNQIEISFSYPTSRSFNAFSVNVSTIYDDDFLISTQHINEGILQICDATTCLNNGTCRSHSRGKYTCSCPMFYTGLLCQIEWCDLHRCLNGTCRQGALNVQCDCILGSWGRFCNMDVEGCSLSVCSGNGQCTGNTNSPSCQCTSMATGENCSSVIVHGRLNIGERLLKEPIWIGLIVILNVLLVFGIFYSINRKIGKFCKVSKDNLSKISEKVDTAETTFTGEVYSVEKSLQRFTNIPPIMITTYSPVPEVDEEGGNAATRFFASYNEAERSPISTSGTTNFTQNTDTFLDDGPNVDIVGGRLSLDHLKNDTSFRKQRRDSSVNKSSSLSVPKMVRQETQFDDFALNHRSSITNDCDDFSQTSSNHHVYPKVIIAGGNGDASKRHIIEDLSDDMKIYHDTTRLSDDTGIPNEQVADETRSVGLSNILSKDHRQKLKRFQNKRKHCRSLDVGLDRPEARTIRLKQKWSEYHHHHRRQLPTCHDSNSCSFYDGLSRWDIIYDWCRNNSDQRRRERFQRQISGKRANERDISNERDLDVIHRRAKHVSNRRSKNFSSGTSHRNSLSNSYINVGRHDILRKFLSQDVTDLYVDNTNFNSNISANYKSLSLDYDHPQPNCYLSSVAPKSSLPSETDSDNYLSSAHKSMDASPHRIMTQTTWIDLETNCHLSVGRHLKDSAYETKQPSLEQCGQDLPGILEGNLRLVRLPSRSEDKRVTQRLHQVAIKLFVLQQRNINLTDSRGSAVDTVCEHDIQSSVPVLTSYSPVLEFHELGLKGINLSVAPTGNNSGDLDQASHESATDMEV